MHGISISTLTGDNGIINQAIGAREETNKNAILEELNLKMIEIQMEEQR